MILWRTTAPERVSEIRGPRLAAVQSFSRGMHFRRISRGHKSEDDQLCISSSSADSSKHLHWRLRDAQIVTMDDEVRRLAREIVKAYKG